MAAAGNSMPSASKSDYGVRLNYSYKTPGKFLPFFKDSFFKDSANDAHRYHLQGIYDRARAWRRCRTPPKAIIMVMGMGVV